MKTGEDTSSFETAKVYTNAHTGDERIERLKPVPPHVRKRRSLHLPVRSGVTIPSVTPSRVCFPPALNAAARLTLPENGKRFSLKNASAGQTRGGAYTWICLSERPLRRGSAYVSPTRLACKALVFPHFGKPRRSAFALREDGRTLFPDEMEMSACTPRVGMRATEDVKKLNERKKKAFVTMIATKKKGKERKAIPVSVYRSECRRVVCIAV